MKHLKKKRELGRNREQRKALLKTLLGSLIMKEKIRTTEAKAKEVKKIIDKVVNKAKKAQDKTKQVAVFRNLLREIPRQAAQKITGSFLDKFKNRNSGYTRVVKLAPRKSDNAKVAVIEFV